MCICQLKQLAFLTISAYTLGSIPFGFLLFKLFKKGTITKFGSGNIGATNVFRKSKLLGLLTLICDMAKGAISVYVARIFCDDYPAQLFGGVCAVLGHIFPVWLSFRGGKGVATGIAVLASTNWLVGVFTVATWICAFIVGKIPGLASLMSSIAAPLLTYYLTRDTNLVIANSVICTLIIIRHYKNIKDLINRIRK